MRRVDKECRFVAFATTRHGREIRRVCFQNNSIKRQIGQIIFHATILVGRHAALAEMKAKFKIDFCLFLRSREAVHDTAKASVLVLFEDVHHLVEGIAAMDGKRKFQLFGPIQLGFNSVKLLFLKG